MPRPDAMRFGGSLESTNPPMPEPHNFRTSSELELLRALIESLDGSALSQTDIQEGLESGVVKVMLLEGQLRKQASAPSGSPPADEPQEDQEIVEAIRALREAVAELRARAIPGGCAPLAQGFVLRRKP